MASSTLDLSKLTIPVLKNMCRDRNLKGWAKFRKQQLVDLLNSTPPAPSAAVAPKIISAPPTASRKLSTASNAAPRTTSPKAAPTSNTSKASQHSVGGGKNSSSSSQVQSTIDKEILAMNSPDIPKRRTSHGGLRPAGVVTSAASKSNDVVASPLTVPSPIAPPSSEGTYASDDEDSIMQDAELMDSSPIRGGSSPTGNKSDIHHYPESERFRYPALHLSLHHPKPPVVPSAQITASPSRHPSQSAPAASPARSSQDTPHQPFKPPKFLAKPPQKQLPADIIPQPSLTHIVDRPNIDIALPRPIPRPCSRSLQGRVFHIALALRDVEDADRLACQLVCREWHHAVFLSVHFILVRDFPGRRCREYLAGNTGDPYLTNHWPYLKQRRQELSRVHQDHNASFARRAATVIGAKLGFPFLPIETTLSYNPDHELQLSTAVRFVVARLFIATAIDSAQAQAWVTDTVADAQPLGAYDDDVWQITTRDSNTLEISQKFFVVAATGEVIGHFRGLPSESAVAEEGLLHIRTDWADYIRSRMEDPSPAPRRLWDRVYWQDVEEYYVGISKAWLRRLDTDPERVRIARRYILANVVGNSVSGSYKTPLQMAQDLEGNNEVASSSSASFPTPARPAQTTVNLFVARSNYVESVHLHEAQHRVAYHPAVASIQTPAREVFILRETGQEIGCEDEGGICVLWRELLGCSASGTISE